MIMDTIWELLDHLWFIVSCVCSVLFAIGLAGVLLVGCLYAVEALL